MRTSVLLRVAWKSEMIGGHLLEQCFSIYRFVMVCGGLRAFHAVVCEMNVRSHIQLFKIKYIRRDTITGDLVFQKQSQDSDTFRQQMHTEENAKDVLSRRKGIPHRSMEMQEGKKRDRKEQF